MSPEGKRRVGKKISTQKGKRKKQVMEWKDTDRDDGT